MSVELTEAQARLDAFLHPELQPIAGDVLRTRLIDDMPVVLSAGVLEQEDGNAVVWYSLSARRNICELGRVMFALELSSDEALPPNLEIECAVGRSIVRQVLKQELRLEWDVGESEITNRKSKRVEKVLLRLI